MFKVNNYFIDFIWYVFVCFQIERYVSLMLVVNFGFNGYKSFSFVLCISIFFFEVFRYFFVFYKVSGVLIMYDIFIDVRCIDWMQCFQYFKFFVLNVIGI